MSDAGDERIPLTLVAGFLGAGKTTLLGRALADPATGRAAVIVNEFGDVGIDGSLVVGAREELIELDGGCVCCTLRGDLAATLRDLLARRRAQRRAVAFDRVLLEASGLAAPGPVAETLLAFDDLRAAFHLDGIVCVVHAALGRRQLAAHVEAEEQAAFADLFVVNQVDRADEGEIAALEAELARRQPFAACLRTVRGDVASGALFGLRERAGGMRFVAAVGGTTHSDARAIVLESDAPVDLDALVLWMRFLARKPDATLWRAKGIVRARGSGHATAVHVVGPFVDVVPLAGERPERSRFVVLGRGFDAAELERGWRAVARE